MEQGIIEGDNPVSLCPALPYDLGVQRVGLFGTAAKMGGKFHLKKLNITERPIANKYREGKMKRTLKRELKVREMKREAIQRCRVELTKRGDHSGLINAASEVNPSAACCFGGLSAASTDRHSSAQSFSGGSLCLRARCLARSWLIIGTVRLWDVALACAG